MKKHCASGHKTKRAWWTCGTDRQFVFYRLSLLVSLHRWKSTQSLMITMNLKTLLTCLQQTKPSWLCRVIGTSRWAQCSPSSDWHARLDLVTTNLERQSHKRARRNYWKNLIRKCVSPPRPEKRNGIRHIYKSLEFTKKKYYRHGST